MGRLKTIPPRLKSVGTRMTQHRPAEADRQARRALPTNSKAWALLRDEVITRDCSICQSCGLLVRGKGEAHVDHIDGNSRNNALSNLQLLHRGCHSKKTAKENGGFGLPRKI